MSNRVAAYLVTSKVQAHGPFKRRRPMATRPPLGLSGLLSRSTHAALMRTREGRSARSRPSCELLHLERRPPGPRRVSSPAGVGCRQGSAPERSASSRSARTREVNVKSKADSRLVAVLSGCAGRDKNGAHQRLRANCRGQRIPAGKKSCRLRCTSKNRPLVRDEGDGSK